MWQSLLVIKAPPPYSASSEWSMDLVAAHLHKAMVPEHNPMVLWDLLYSLHRQLDDVLEVLFAGGQLLWVDVRPLERREESSMGEAA